MYAWDNYTRQLAIGWARDGMSPNQIADCWPWPTKPSANAIRKQIEHATSVRGRASVRAGAVVSAALQPRPDKGEQV